MKDDGFDEFFKDYHSGMSLGFVLASIGLVLLGIVYILILIL